MTDGFGARFSVGAVAAPVVAALLAGSTAYAVQQDSFDTTEQSVDDTASSLPKKDKALVSLKQAVRAEEHRLDRLRAQLDRTQRATRATIAQARQVADSAGSGWTPSVSVSTGGSGSGGSGFGGSGSGGSGSGGSGGSTSSSTQPSTHTSSGASGA